MDLWFVEKFVLDRKGFETEFLQFSCMRMKAKINVRERNVEECWKLASRHFDDAQKSIHAGNAISMFVLKEGESMHI